MRMTTSPRRGPGGDPSDEQVFYNYLMQLTELRLYKLVRWARNLPQFGAISVSLVIWVSHVHEGNLIIMINEAFVKCKILSIETILSACTHAHTHAGLHVNAHTHTRTCTYAPTHMSIPTLKLKGFGEQSSSVQAPLVWDSLPACLLTSDTAVLSHSS